MNALDQLLAAIDKLDTQERQIIAIAGAPASGKSTLAEQSCNALNQTQANYAAVLPMDGYHYDDNYLKQLGRYERKGAHDTFDVGGFATMLARLKANKEETIVTPIFDRDNEIARAGANPINQTIKLILVEGNYLLINKAPWLTLQNYFDLKIFIDVDEEILKQRLRQRWLNYQYSEEQIQRKLDQVDLPNGKFVIDNSIGFDVTIKIKGL